MELHPFNDFKVAPLTQIVEEYRKLIRLSLPSVEELDRISWILEQAMTDPELNDALQREDEELGEELDYIEENALDGVELGEKSHGKSLKFVSHSSSKELNVSSKVLMFPGSKQVVPKKWGLRGFDVKYVSSFLVGGILIFAVCTCLKNQEPENTRLQMPQHHSSRMSPSLLSVGNKGDQASVCNLDHESNPQLQEYYIKYSKLDEEVTNQKLQPLQIKMHVNKLQKTAEIRQKQLEAAQRYAESQKYQAERRNQYDVAQKWKDKAMYSLEQSRQWLCLSQNVLALY